MTGISIVDKNVKYNPTERVRINTAEICVHRLVAILFIVQVPDQNKSGKVLTFNGVRSDTLNRDQTVRDRFDDGSGETDFSHVTQ
jgi:hypothetical protein